MFVAEKKRKLSSKTIDIKNLLTLLSEDNRVAFNLFYDLYYDQVFRFAYYFLKDTEACREVVADAFFSVWQSRLKLKEIGNIETYLFIVVRNESTRYLTRVSRDRFVSLEEAKLQLEVKGGISPEDELLTAEIDNLLNQVINSLPEKCRMIFAGQTGRTETERDSRKIIDQ